MKIFGPCFRASIAVAALTSSIVSALHSRPAISFGRPPVPFTYTSSVGHWTIAVVVPAGNGASSLER
uniref:Putative secreted protein n=1 Tax=Anopheles darlingi TaxID=43151 RepID=A0A2M4D370_ANODA